MNVPQALRAVLARALLITLAAPGAAASGLTGCNKSASQNKQADDGAEAQGSVEDVSIQLEVDKTRVLQKEADLQASTKSIAAQQAKLERERAEAEEKLSSISQADKASRQKAVAVQAAIAEQEQLLRTRTAELEASRAQLDKDKTALLTRAIKPQAPAPAAPEAEPTHVRAREEAVAKREAFLAAREKEVAEREATAAHSMAELKALMEALRNDVSELKLAPPQAAMPQPSAGAQVSHGQLVKAVKAIRQKMGAKGILTEDLPQGMQAFAQTASGASAGREASSAMALCDRVLQVVDATPINHAFVEGKMARINRALATHSAKLDAGNQKKVQEFLSEATDAFSDGRYDRANKKINQICALLPGSEAR